MNYREEFMDMSEEKGRSRVKFCSIPEPNVYLVYIRIDTVQGKSREMAS